MSDSYQPRRWHVAFVQDCNLRCGYCCTGFGRFGRSSRLMAPEVWGPLSDLILALSSTQPRICVEFGTGETFLHFEEAMRFLDHLRRLAVVRGVRIEAEITTNGTLATAGQLHACIERRISLCFSIDGCAAQHDAYRRFPDGKPSHRIALANWRRYREAAASAPDAPRCEAHSVVADGARLRDVARFWRKTGLARYRAVPASPGGLRGCRELHGWEVRRAEYLHDLREIAMSETARLRGRDLEKEFEGPAGIVGAWRRLSSAAPYRGCGAGYSTIAVDAGGVIFPCQGFIGFAERSIGNVRSGLDTSKLADFREARSRVQSACRGCWARFLCEGGCCAGDPKAGVVLDTWKGCEFSQALVEIAVESYHNWCGRGGGS